MVAEKTVDIDIDIDLSPIKIEGKLNAMHYRKQWKRRFVVREEDGIIYVRLVNNQHNFMQALLVNSKLIPVKGVSALHWQIIKRLFKEEYGDQIDIC